MPWKVVGLQKLEEAVAIYRLRVASGVKSAVDDESSRKALAARADWKAFLAKVKNYGQHTDDPDNYLHSLMTDGQEVPGYYIVREGSYTLIYSRDDGKDVLNPVVLYHKDDRELWLKWMFDHFRDSQ